MMRPKYYMIDGYNDKYRTLQEVRDHVFFAPDLIGETVFAVYGDKYDTRHMGTITGTPGNVVLKGAESYEDWAAKNL